MMEMNDVDDVDDRSCARLHTRGIGTCEQRGCRLQLEPKYTCSSNARTDLVINGVFLFLAGVSSFIESKSFFKLCPKESLRQFFCPTPYHVPHHRHTPLLCLSSTRYQPS